MSMNTKKELLHRMRWQYAKADKTGKTEIINTIVSVTGYNRKYATAALKKTPSTLSSRTKAKRVYGETTKRLLVSIWTSANQICSKRLAPFLPEYIDVLERFGHLQISVEEKSKLLSLSPATIDRLLKDERAKHPRGRTTTSPGNLLKQRIKIRTFSDWNETSPGFFECDLVAHCGDHVDGEFLNTLVLTDINTGWTEFAPLFRKSDDDVAAGLDAIRIVLPVALLGLDSDNGSEFINEKIFEYCEKEKITFTRSRPYKKNDQAHVEQKNGNIVRRTVGYDRFEGAEAWTRLLNLYRILRLYVNYFQPSCKLLDKVRIGSRVKKIYDKAKTPYQRMLESPHVASRVKRKIKTMYATLDPVRLFEEMGQLQKLMLQAADLDLSLLKPLNLKDSPLVNLCSLRPLRKMQRRYRYSRLEHLVSSELEAIDLSDKHCAVNSLHKNGLSNSGIARQLELSRNTVSKYLRVPDAPKYTLSKPRERPVSNDWRNKVRALVTKIESSSTERVSVGLIFKYLQSEGYDGSRGTVRNMLADLENMPRKRESTTSGSLIKQLMVSTDKPLLAVTK